MGSYPYLKFTQQEVTHLQERLSTFASLCEGLPYIAYQNAQQNIELLNVASDQTELSRIKSIAKDFFSNKKRHESSVLIATLCDFNQHTKALFILDSPYKEKNTILFDTFRSYFDEQIKAVITRIEPLEAITLPELLNSFEDNWWIKNREGKYFLYNDKSISNLQDHHYTHNFSGNYKGKTDAQLFPPKIAQHFQSIADATFNAKTQLFFENIRQEDEPINAATYELISAAIKRDNEVIGLVGHTRDTSMYTLKDEIQQLKAELFNYTLDFVVIIDNQETIIDCNSSLFTRLGYAHDEMKGNYYKKFVHQHSYVDIKYYLKQLKKHDIVTGQFFLQTQREEIVPIKFRIFVQRDSNRQIENIVVCAQELFDSALRPENFEHKELLDQYFHLEEKYLHLNDRLRKTLQKKKEYQSLFEASTNGLWYSHIPKDGEVSRKMPVYFSQKFRHMLGYKSEQDFPSIADSWISHLHIKDFEKVAEVFMDLVYNSTKNSHIELTFRMKRKAGDYHWYNCTINVEKDPRGKTTMCSGQLIDVDTQMVEHMAMDGMYPIAVTDSNSRITKVNRAFINEFGYSEDELIGRDPALFQAKVYPQEFYQKIRHTLHSDGFWRGEILCQHKDGTQIPILLNIQSVTSQDGQLFHNIGTYANISQQKEMETKLKHLSEVDPMTSCFNRAVYEYELERQTQLVMTRSDHLACLAIIDIDYFKKINDKYGHQAGDTVIKSFANCLKEIARKSDFVARIGGEEFALIMPNANITAASRLLMRIHRYLNTEKIAVQSYKKKMLKITASFGITQIQKGDSMDDVYKRADHALYIAKKSGRNSIYTDDGTCIISAQLDDNSN